MVDPLVMTLRDLQSNADRQHVRTGQHIQAPMTWKALNQILQQQGNPEIGYDEFAARWDSDPVLKQLVARFDGHGLVINTKGSEETHKAKSGPSAMDKMAKRATDKAFK